MMRHRMTVGRCALVVLLCGVLGSVPVTAAVGATRGDVERRQDEVDEQRRQSQAELSEIGGGLAAAAARLGELTTQVPAAREVVVTAEAAAAGARARDAELAGELAVADAQIEATRADLRVQQSATRQTQDDVTAVVRETYTGTDLGGLAILIEAGSPQEYVDLVLVARTARKAQNDTLERLAVQRVQLRLAEAQLESQVERLDGLKVVAEERVSETQVAEVAARDAQAALEALVVEQKASVAGFEAARVAEEEEQRQLQTTSDALSQQLAAIAAAETRQAAAAEQTRRDADAAARAVVPRPAAGAAAPDSGTGSGSGGGSAAGGALAYPTGGRVTSSFGYRQHPILNYQKLHTGTDFGVACGSPITAAADGEIVSAGWAGGYGNQVVVSHGRVAGVSLATSYNHLTSFVVTSGSVSRGQLIAYSGTTGLSTGCHLHFETRESGAPVDPMKWLG